MAAVARAVGTPGVQRVGYPCLLPALPLHRDRTGGMPLPPPRHPAALFRRSAVPCGPAVGRRRHPCRVAGRPAPFRWFFGRVGRGTLERRNTAASPSTLRWSGKAVRQPSAPPPVCGHCWLRRCREQASPLSVRQRFACFRRPLPGSGPLHGPACGGRGRWASLLEHRCCQFGRRAVRRFRRFCRGVLRLRFQP